VLEARKKVKRFAELFALWHGRPPRDDEWPAPRKNGGKGTYEWQAPELALLASLVGRMGKRRDRRRILTEAPAQGHRRSPRRTHAHRVQIAINHQLGLQTTDVVGGITIAEAGRETGARNGLDQAIRTKALRPPRRPAAG
jgi:hypothetical protein